jgi:HAD superfamily hydrolase (TIGR01509 family)
MLDAIVFDIGNVLLSFDFEKTFRRVAPACGVSPDQVVSRLSALKGPLESGQISADVFLEEVSRELDYRGDAEELRFAWQEIFEPIEETHALVRRLHKRIPLYLLSNTNDLHTEYFLPRYPVFECFEDAIFSHEVRVMKPDPAIYRAALDRFQIEPQKMLFIDDLAENVAAAAGLGIRTHHYAASRHADLERVVSDAGF